MNRVLTGGAVAALALALTATSGWAAGSSDDSSRMERSSSPAAPQPAPQAAPAVPQPTVADAWALIEAEQYAEAIDQLEDIVASEPRNADAFNYLGYASRQIERYNDSLGYYEQALAIDPNHAGALNYLGHLYIETGNLDMARQQLGRLSVVCPSGCSERDELAEALTTAAASY